MSNLYKSTLASAGTAPTGDAVAADVLAGKTFSNASATGVTGTMVNNGAVDVDLTAGQTYTVPAGYHNGQGTVTAPAVAPFIGANKYLDSKISAINDYTDGTTFTVGTSDTVIINTVGKSSVTWRLGSTGTTGGYGIKDGVITSLTFTTTVALDISAYDYVGVRTPSSADSAITVS